MPSVWGVQIPPPPALRHSLSGQPLLSPPRSSDILFLTHYKVPGAATPPASAPARWERSHLMIRTSRWSWNQLWQEVRGPEVSQCLCSRWLWISVPLGAFVHPRLKCVRYLLLREAGGYRCFQRWQNSAEVRVRGRQLVVPSTWLWRWIKMCSFPNVPLEFINNASSLASHSQWVHEEFNGKDIKDLVGSNANCRFHSFQWHALFTFLSFLTFCVKCPQPSAGTC